MRDSFLLRIAKALLADYGYKFKGAKVNTEPITPKLVFQAHVDE
jgi:hypothetical protein